MISILFISDTHDLKTRRFLAREMIVDLIPTGLPALQIRDKVAREMGEDAVFHRMQIQKLRVRTFFRSFNFAYLVYY